MLIVFLIALFVIIIVYFLMSLEKPPEVEFGIEPFPTDNTHYKIGAEVSCDFHDEVKQYCSNHQMTISDLIRMSVRSYMDTNP